MTAWILVWWVFLHQDCAICPPRGTPETANIVNFSDTNIPKEYNAIIHCYQRYEIFDSTNALVSAYEKLNNESQASAKIFSLQKEHEIKPVISPKFQLQEAANGKP